MDDSVNSVDMLDSLDLDSGVYITTLFPDTIRKHLYSVNDSLWDYVFSGIDTTSENRIFPQQTLYKVLLANGFIIDTIDQQFVGYKKTFNKRQIIEFSVPFDSTILVSNQIWVDGQKYLLLTAEDGNPFEYIKTFQNFR